MYFSLLFFSLLKAVDPQIDFNPPDYVENMPEKEFIPEFNKAGSLFGQGDRPLFADRRAMKPDDLITIIIDESSESSFNTNKTYNGSSGGNVTPPTITYNGDDASQKEATDYLNNQANFSLQKSNNTSNFQGGGNQNRSQATKMTITARIVKVLENGNYFIYGNKEILVDGEKQVMRLSGVIRPYDISRENTIQSKFIADAKIEYKSIGAISNTTRQKPTTEAIEDQWPF
ncbi:flagellar basal body L-ring protein FlgH [Helicobacter kayseriensis]|uniref:flagellar basal body L-ring protein FlgH n=1 Tax=Helicobacter kayseriensis TaxID=2905877 RepID=UPI001E58C02B|nr:flagellar basal body L-ring protein FlgH [Helicobacter kayseriensis]MCE3046603.1 flagellar basal body L-ring protein FlgH [Helicobacter kayseriensis]MCE3048095.1 flagellar basal body L-ring protein FlgH [Helicobacter kayseriensis]